MRVRPETTVTLPRIPLWPLVLGEPTPLPLAAILPASLPAKETSPIRLPSVMIWPVLVPLPATVMPPERLPSPASWPMSPLAAIRPDRLPLICTWLKRLPRLTTLAPAARLRLSSVGTPFISEPMSAPTLCVTPLLSVPTPVVCRVPVRVPPLRLMLPKKLVALSVLRISCLPRRRLMSPMVPVLEMFWMSRALSMAPPSPWKESWVTTGWG